MLDKIKKDHKRKSNQVKKLQRKLKNKAKSTISVDVLKTMLLREEGVKLDYRDYYSWGEYDDNAYRRDDERKEARIELLKELLRKTEENLR